MFDEDQRVTQAAVTKTKHLTTVLASGSAGQAATAKGKGGRQAGEQVHEDWAHVARTPIIVDAMRRSIPIAGPARS